MEVQELSYKPGKPAVMKLLGSRRWSILIRVGLGGLFVYASVPKVMDPPAFAHILWNYKILPDLLISPLAIVLPWIELLVGIALVLGILRGGAALLAGLLLLTFVAGLSVDVARGIAIDCGCFSVSATNRTHSELMRGMKLDLLRDLGMLLMAAHLLLTQVNWGRPPLNSDIH